MSLSIDSLAWILAAESGGVMDFPLPTAVVNLILFVVVVFVLGKFVWPKILLGLDARQEKIHNDIVSATEANDQAKTLLAEYEAKLTAAQSEAQQLVEQARRDAEQLRERQLALVELELTQLRQRTTDEIRQAKQQAVQALYAQATQLATAVAGKLIEREINETDMQMLIDQSLGELDKLDGVG